LKTFKLIEFGWLFIYIYIYIYIYAPKLPFKKDGCQFFFEKNVVCNSSNLVDVLGGESVSTLVETSSSLFLSCGKESQWHVLIRKSHQQKLVGEGILVHKIGLCT
jgi:hypothetical protein